MGTNNQCNHFCFIHFTRKNVRKVTWHVKAKSYIPLRTIEPVNGNAFCYSTPSAENSVSFADMLVVTHTNVPFLPSFVLDPLIFTECPSAEGPRNQRSWISIWRIGNVISVTYLTDVSRYLRGVMTMTHIYFLHAGANFFMQHIFLPYKYWY